MTDRQMTNPFAPPVHFALRLPSAHLPCITERYCTSHLISRPDFSNWVLRGYSLPALLIQRRIEDCVETDRSCARNLLDEHVCKISKIQPFADFWNVTTAQTNFPAACVWFYKLLEDRQTKGDLVYELPDVHCVGNEAG